MIINSGNLDSVFKPKSQESMNTSKSKRTPLNAEPLMIRRVDAIPVAIPLTKPIVMGGGQRYEHSESLIVRIEAANGLVGWGEASAAPTMTGDMLAGMVQAVEQHLAPLLVGSNALLRAQLAHKLSRAVIGNTGPKAACDVALHDLAGRHLGVPLVELLGGKARESVCALSQLGNSRVEDDIAEARTRRREGYRFFKLKVGVKPVEEEIGGVHALRKALGPDVILCADANMSMTPSSARKFVLGAADANILFLEQPLRDHDLVGALALARMSPIPLCADESAHSLESIMNWRSAGAIAGVTLKTIKLGGMASTARAAIVCDALGMSLNLASKTGESSIGAAALVHLSYAIPNIDWGINITNQYLSTDLVRQPIGQKGGSVECPTAPGLGIDVDERAIARFKVVS